MVQFLRNRRSPVPVQSACVMPVKEVRFGAQGADVRMEPEELQQSPGSPLLNPDDESLGKPPGGRPLFSRAVRLQLGVTAARASAGTGTGHLRLLPPALAASVSSVRPCRREEASRRRLLDLGDVRQLRLAAAGKQVHQGEAEDAQRGRDGEPVEEPPEVRARLLLVLLVVRVWVQVRVVRVKGCHPSEIIRAR